MSHPGLTAEEVRYLSSSKLLARVATVGADGTPHITPVGWRLVDGAYIEVTGRDFARTKKFRDASARPRAAIVIDEVLPPWRPRGVEIRGRAEAFSSPHPHLRIHPDRVFSWGIDSVG